MTEYKILPRRANPMDAGRVDVQVIQHDEGSGRSLHVSFREFLQRDDAEVWLRETIRWHVEHNGSAPLVTEWNGREWAGVTL